jgi:simple sugar transport system ATP-binding protein
VTGEYVVEMRGISKSFGQVQAVKDVNLELRRGEILGLVGDNGAGKSTLMKILTGLYAPDEGEIWVEGKRATLRSPQDARPYGIEMIYQDLALFDNLDVAANVYIGRELKRPILGIPFLDHRGMHTEVRKVLQRLRIGIDSPDLLVGGLSGGQRQCTALARALSFEAKVLIMDEPTAALGVHEVSTLLKLVEGLKAHGVSIIMISHRLPDILAVGDRVMVMKGGRRVGILEVAVCTLDDCVELIVRGDAPRGGNGRNSPTTEEAVRATS